MIGDLWYLIDRVLERGWCLELDNGGMGPRTWTARFTNWGRAGEPKVQAEDWSGAAAIQHAIRRIEADDSRGTADGPQPVDVPLTSVEVAAPALDLIEEILGRSAAPADWDRLQMLARTLDDALHPLGRLETFRRAIIEDSEACG